MRWCLFILIMLACLGWQPAPAGEPKPAAPPPFAAGPDPEAELTPPIAPPTAGPSGAAAALHLPTSVEIDPAAGYQIITAEIDPAWKPSQIEWAAATSGPRPVNFTPLDDSAIVAAPPPGTTVYLFACALVTDQGKPVLTRHAVCRVTSVAAPGPTPGPSPEPGNPPAPTPTGPTPTGPAPPSPTPAPGPTAGPGATPTPIPPGVQGLSVSLILDLSGAAKTGIDPGAAAVANSEKIRSTLRSINSRFYVFDVNASKVKSNGFSPLVQAAGGPPALIIQDPAGKVLPAGQAVHLGPGPLTEFGVLDMVGKATGGK